MVECFKIALKYIIFTFILLYLFSCQKNKTVLIQGLGEVEKRELQFIQNELQGAMPSYTFYVSDVNIDLPSAAFVKIKSPRYRADKLLRFLLEIKSDTISHIIGYTEKDISFTKRDAFGLVKEPKNKYEDWGIFGLAYVPGKSCVISSFRLHNKSREKYLKRLSNVCIHEFGHNLGLPHCPNTSCVMTDAAETIKTVDKVKGSFCEKCFAKIQ